MRTLASRASSFEISRHETGGNAIGIGLADFTTRRLVDKIDIAVTNLNCITAVTPEKARIPIAFENDRLALSAVFQTIGPKDASSVRLAWIRNTLALDDLWVSPAALAAIAPGVVERTAGPVDMAFDRRRQPAIAMVIGVES